MKKNQWIAMGCALVCTMLAGCSKQADTSSGSAKGSTEATTEAITEAMMEESSPASSVSEVSAKLPEFLYQEYIRKAGRESLLKETDLEEADLTEDSAETGRYYLNDSILIEGYDFTPYVLFSKSEEDTDMLYGSGYQAVIEYDDAAVLKLLEALESDLTSVYSDAITYEGLDSKFSDYRALSEEERKAVKGSYEEQWDAGGQENQYIYCSLRIADGNAVIEISNRITSTPDSKQQ